MEGSVQALLVGLFGGAGATFVWELVLKPLRERRAVAEVLSAEVSMNLQLLAAAKTLASSTRLPADFTVSTAVFDSVVTRIGELPPRLVGEVVFLYSYFSELNGQPRMYRESVKELRAYQAGTQKYTQVQMELLAQVGVFNQYVDKVIARVNLIQPLLLKAAFPWWSPRRWRRPPAVELKMDELAQRMARSQREREALGIELQRRPE